MGRELEIRKKGNSREKTLQEVQKERNVRKKYLTITRIIIVPKINEIHLYLTHFICFMM